MACSTLITPCGLSTDGLSADVFRTNELSDNVLSTKKSSKKIGSSRYKLHF